MWLVKRASWIYYACAQDALSRYEVAPLRPQHVLIFPDGNRRWATMRGLPSSVAHSRGSWKADEVINWCKDRRIRHLSLYLVSAANLKRDPSTLEPMVEILTKVIQHLATVRSARFLPVGDLSILPPAMAAALVDAHSATSDVSGMSVNLIAGYSPEWELTQAIAQTAASQEPPAHAALSSLFFPYGQQPSVDLIIRTSGERRLSGLLPWQSAQAELHFTPVLWPDYTEHHFQEAINDFAQRTRRFGL